MPHFIKLKLLSVILLFCSNLSSDSFKYNHFNNHGSIGLINMPTARFLDESAYGFTAFDGTPDQKITMTAYPYNWLEASVFYTNIQDKPYPNYEFQDYKDKGFNIKLRLKEEGVFPSIAIGMNDIAGTGFYSSEYIVSSYGIDRLDLHFGLGWGNLNGFDDFNNPLINISERFESRPSKFKDRGGSFDINRYFSGKSVSPFFGISYLLKENMLLKVERDSTLTPGIMGYKDRNSQLSFGFDYSLKENFVIGFSIERDNYLSLRISYKNKKENKRNYSYKKDKDYKSKNKYRNFINYVQDNGVGVNKIVKNQDGIVGIEVTQFTHPSLEILEEIILSAKIDSNIDDEILTNYKIVDMTAVQNFDNKFEKDAEVIYSRKRSSGLSSNTRLTVRPFIAGREGFLKGAILLENDNEYLIRDNFTFSSNLKYSIWDNFDDFIYPPVDTYPAQVRSDVKDYLKNFDGGIVIGRAQFDYYKTISKNNHIMFTGGILEEMFQGYGFEYLWFDNTKNYALGFEVFDVTKRDYQLRFGTLDYKNITAHANLYYRNYSFIPFDAKISFGEYLAGDVGTTIELSRTFKSGIKFGIFASKTNVSSEQFGEGSFDKGIFFTIPVLGDSINASWRPLTKDPAQKLIRRNNLHDLLVKFRPLN